MALPTTDKERQIEELIEEAITRIDEEYVHRLAKKIVEVLDLQGDNGTCMAALAAALAAQLTSECPAPEIGAMIFNRLLCAYVERIQSKKGLH